MHSFANFQDPNAQGHAYRRQDGKLKLRLQEVCEENKKLCERIFMIMNDDR